MNEKQITLDKNKFHGTWEEFLKFVKSKRTSDTILKIYSDGTNKKNVTYKFEKGHFPALKAGELAQLVPESSSVHKINFILNEGFGLPRLSDLPRNTKNDVKYKTTTNWDDFVNDVKFAMKSRKRDFDVTILKKTTNDKVVTFALI